MEAQAIHTKLCSLKVEVNPKVWNRRGHDTDKRRTEILIFMYAGVFNLLFNLGASILRISICNLVSQQDVKAPVSTRCIKLSLDLNLLIV